MKRENNIYPRIVERNNIYVAILNASKKKKGRKNVQKVIANIDKCTDLIREMLVNKKFKPSPYEQVKIQDGVRKKERVIFKPAFYPDQIVHWALMQHLEPILRKGMYDYCCASVKGRGILYGARYLKKILVKDRKNTKYCLKLDVKKFYPSINQNIMKRKFRTVIKDNDTLELIDKIIESVDEGLPIR